MNKWNMVLEDIHQIEEDKLISIAVRQSKHGAGGIVQKTHGAPPNRCCLKS